MGRKNQYIQEFIDKRKDYACVLCDERLCFFDVFMSFYMFAKNGIVPNVEGNLIIKENWKDTFCWCMEEKGILLCPIEYQTRTENLQECGDKIDNKRELKGPVWLSIPF